MDFGVLEPLTPTRRDKSTLINANGNPERIAIVQPGVARYELRRVATPGGYNSERVASSR